MRILILLPLVALAACVRPSGPPPAPAPVTPVPAPTQAPAPAPLASDWRDWPITAGDWSYSTNPRGSIASFGTPGSTPQLTLQCDRQMQRLILSRASNGMAPPTSMTVRTTSLTRALPVQPAANGPHYSTLTPRDPLLDAIAFSRGRFLVESEGAPYLAIPAWAEVARVTEDCR